MAQYASSTCSNDNVSADWVAAETASIATALGKCLMPFVVQDAAVAADQVNTTIAHEVVIPVAGTVTNVSVIANTEAGTVDGTVDIWNQTGTPATILSAPITIAAADTAYAGTIATAAVAANDVLTVRYVTDGTSHDGELTDVTITILVRPAHGL